jgi:hypothetical protein
LLDPHHTVGNLEDLKGFEVLWRRQAFTIHDHVWGMDAHWFVGKELALGLIPVQFPAEKGITLDVVYAYAVADENGIPGLVVNGKKGVQPAFYL